MIVFATYICLHEKAYTVIRKQGYQPRSFKEAIKARLAALKARDATAQLVDNKDSLKEEYAAIKVDGDKVGVDKVDKVYPANQS